MKLISRRLQGGTPNAIQQESVRLRCCMLIQIRRAKPNEAESLTAIAHAAKRHWGYPESWIERWTSDLAITPDFIANNEVFVAVNGGKIVGSCALVSSDSVAEL